MTRRLISIEVDGSIFAIRGWKAHGLAIGAGLRPTYSGVRGAWVADTKRLPDLVAHLERRRIAFDVIEPEAPVLVRDETPRAPVEPADTALFEFGS